MTFAESQRAAAVAYLTDCLQQAGGNVTRAAKLSGMDRGSLYRRLKRYGISNPSPQPAGRPRPALAESARAG